MAYALIRHKVKDYLDWKFVFVEHANTRRAEGSQGGQLFRNADQPDEVVILMEWDTVENARRFLQSDELKQAMQKAGVASTPELVVLEKVEAPSW